MAANPLGAGATAALPARRARPGAWTTLDGKTIGKGARYGMVKDWSPDLTVFLRTDLLKGLKVHIPGPTLSCENDNGITP